MAKASRYKETLNLPSTDFPMRGDLARREPKMLERWQTMAIEQRIAAARAEAPRCVLHDGPPYSNGNVHYGHVLNKILKDLVVKSRTMAGYRSPFVPGWDTHGLPIELAVERELAGKKDRMSKVQIRAACRDYALQFVAIQRREFRRLGVFGFWDRPYLTLDHSYEAVIVRALAAFARGGYLYRGKRPVHWCPNCETALAEAEIEYKSFTSPSVYVRFAMAGDFDPGHLEPRLAGRRLALVIWTTTPWTLPANLAIVLSRDFEYVAVPSPRDAGEFLLVAKNLAAAFLEAIGGGASDAAAAAAWIPIAKERLAALEGARYLHPLQTAPRAAPDFRVWFADYVTLEQGTGLVHTAPGHGTEDYETGVAHGLDVFSPLDEAGRFTAEVPAWLGHRVWDANPSIVERLARQGTLLNRPGETVEHSYAHCWRCKGPLLFRATPQWFIKIDHRSLRQRALTEIDRTQWVPGWGRNRIHGMIEHRPDWCLSRQRAWGVPIVAFHCQECGEAHAEASTMEYVADLFAREGADAWYIKPVAELVPPGTRCARCGGSAFRREEDIIDVWFESGCSWLAVQGREEDLRDPDIYLEGSDQHRGWFHSSLLVGIVVADKAPFRTVITHSFVLDEEGHPYSKSAIEEARRRGKKIRYVPPTEVVQRHGAELFRLWVASSEFRTDISYSDSHFERLGDWYRKLRNTCRFMLGNLQDFDANAVPLQASQLCPIDRYALLRLDDFTARVRRAYDAFDFHIVHRALVDFVSGDLSALYLDVVKDRLYSDSPASTSRRAAQLVIYDVVRALALLGAPILSFTAEEIWQHLPKRRFDPESVHLALMPAGKPSAADDPVVADWASLLRYRELVTQKLEAFRAKKHKSVDARVQIRPAAGDRDLLTRYQTDLADLFIVSEVVVADGQAPGPEPQITVDLHPGARCARCWKFYKSLSEVNPEVCSRCAQVLAALDR